MWITKLGLVMLPLWGGLSIYMPVLANTLATACALEAAEPTCYYTAAVSLAQAPEHVGETEPIMGQVDVSATASSSCVIKIPENT